MRSDANYRDTKNLVNDDDFDAIFLCPIPDPV